MGIFNKYGNPEIIKESCSATDTLDKLKRLKEAYPENRNISNDEYKTRTGLKGENIILSKLKKTNLPMYIIRDLWIMSGTEKVQIDFLVVARKHVYIIESKFMNGDFHIHKDESFYSTDKNKKKFRFQSPYEQNLNHIRPLKTIYCNRGYSLVKEDIRSLIFNVRHISVIALANDSSVLSNYCNNSKISKSLVYADSLISFIHKKEKNHLIPSMSDKQMKRLADFYILHNQEPIDFACRYNNDSYIKSEDQQEADEIIIDEPLIPDENLLVEEINEDDNYLNSELLKYKPILCPNCGVDMELRTSTSGTHKGENFFGCPNFPNCKARIAIDGTVLNR